MRRASVAILATAVLLGIVSGPSAQALPIDGIHNIQHVVVIMQENRSFDSYFGTYPGANGIPAGVCVPDPVHGGCVQPFHDSNDENFGGPHRVGNAISDIHGGRMDGFVHQGEVGLKCTTTDPSCGSCASSGTGAACLDVMGYHDAREIPNYWTYAEHYVLQDKMFQSAPSWSLPEHLFLISGWSAFCANGDSNPMDCASSLELWPQRPEVNPNATYAWTDITYLLHNAGVSWGYYVFEGSEPDCENDEAVSCAPVKQGPKTPGIWNPLPEFTDVQQDGQLGNIKSLTNFYTAVHEKSSCGLPNVSWVEPNGTVSEHPPALISVGQAYVTTLINAIMRSPCWNSTAIFLSWDDWGGFYDHVVPPAVDQNGYGLRVPGLVISPYSKVGYVDHQRLSHDAYLKFIEDDFLNGRRLNPATDGRPDPRPDVREETGGLGSLENDFNFNRAPSPPLLLPTHPAPGPASTPPGGIAPRPGKSTTPRTQGTPSLTLQIVVSVAPRQDLRFHHGRVYMTVGCNMTCSVDAHGHLNLTRHHRHLGLRRARATLTGAHPKRIGLALSRSNLASVRRALRRHRTVKALIEVRALGAHGQRQSYKVSVMLSWR
jgi:phospholipase C